MNTRFLTHVLLHAAVPVAVAVIFYRHSFKKASLAMLKGNLIDVDHLLATPMLDPDRCSIGFHPLHRQTPLAIYGLLTLLPPTRLIGLGLVIHVGLDYLDCLRQRRERHQAALASPPNLPTQTESV
jgi:hypothetical protein